MLRYELQRTKFVVRVMKGRNLPARDSPAQTSDPYVVISTIPDWNNEGAMRTSPVNGAVHYYSSNNFDSTYHHPQSYQIYTRLIIGL